MRIGINASFARKPNTGIGQVTLNFLKKLSELKVQSSKLKIDEFVLYLEEDLPEDFKLPDNFKKVIHLPFYRRDDLIRKIWWEKYWLPRQIKKDKCDVFLSLYQCPSFIAKNIKHIMLVHDIIPKLFPEYLNNWRKKIYWKFTEAAIKDADKIIAVSHRTEKDLVQHLKIDPAKITVNYIDVDEIYKNKSRTSRDLQILEKYSLHPGYIYCGGGLEIRKNIEGVILAYHHLYEKNKNVQYLRHFPKLVISGKLMPQLAPLVTDAEKLVKKLNLTEQVKLLDFVPQADLPAIYRNAEFFIYPSFYEGFGLPVLEAMNMGTPVITSKKSSLPEVGSDAVLYCRPDDIQDISMVMKNLLINRHLRDHLSLRGYDRAKYFSWEKFVQKILNIINE
jgi:glycosyltransferase involved in cell wall biosynthesis